VVINRFDFDKGGWVLDFSIFRGTWLGHPTPYPTTTKNFLRVCHSGLNADIDVIMSIKVIYSVDDNASVPSSSLIRSPNGGILPVLRRQKFRNAAIPFQKPASVASITAQSPKPK
jgi:hypothetical protein